MPQNEPASRLALRDLLTVVFKRRKTIAVFTVAVLALVALVTFLSAPIYEVSASLLINKSRANTPLAPQDAPRPVMDRVSQQDLNSELEILGSRQVIEDALTTLGVDDSWRSEGGLGGAIRSMQGSLGAPELSYFDEMIVHLERKLDISNVRRSNVIRVKYRSKDPEEATRLVQSLVDSYIARRADMYQSPQAVSFFEQQMHEAEARLEESEKHLEHFLDGAGITMIKESQGSDTLEAQKELGLERLARLEQQLAEVQAEILERQRKISRLETSLESEPERLASASRLHHSAVIEEIEKALASLELERDALLQEFEPGNRYVRDIENQIALSVTRLERAQTEVRGIDRTEINPVYLELKSELLRVEANLEGSRGRLISLRGHVAQSRRQLDELNNAAFEMEGLRRNALIAEEGYLLYRRKHEEARIESAMDRQKLINVTIAQPAQRPLKPVAPKKAMNLFLGLVLGVVGGLLLAFANELYFDRTFTTGRAIERRLGIPHVVSIPEQALNEPRATAEVAAGGSERSLLRWSALVLIAGVSGVGLLLAPATVESATGVAIEEAVLSETIEEVAPIQPAAAKTPQRLENNSTEPADLAGQAEVIEGLIHSWADAWSDQRPADYLSFYAPTFSPAGIDRQEWEHYRTTRIQAPTTIQVQVSNLGIDLLDTSRAEASFFQVYRADAIHLHTWKTMELARRPEGWLIVDERVDPTPEVTP